MGTRQYCCIDTFEQIQEATPHIYIYIYIYVCVCVCVCVCVYVHVYIYICIDISLITRKLIDILHYKFISPAIWWFIRWDLNRNTCYACMMCVCVKIESDIIHWRILNNNFSTSFINTELLFFSSVIQNLWILHISTFNS